MKRSHPELPGALKTLWLSIGLAFRAEPGLLLATFGMFLLDAIPDALYALWLSLLAAGLIEHRKDLLIGTAIGIVASATGGWLIQTLLWRVERKFRMRVGVALEAHVADLQASVPTLEHHERPEYLDRLAVLRESSFKLDHMYQSLFSFIGAFLRMGITVGLLMTVSPVMGFLLVFALPTVAVSSWRSAAQRNAEERAASRMRLARHLFDLGTTAGPAKEVRLLGIGQRITDERHVTWRDWYRQVSAAQWRTAYWQVAAWALFGAAFVGAIVLAVAVLHAPASRVLLVLAAGSRLSQYVGMTASEAGFLRMWLDASRRLAWLEDFARRHRDAADEAAPQRLQVGIRLDHLTFRYPGTERDVLRDVTLQLPAGAVVAIVGDNGVGKSTLVKLLCRFYEPTKGAIYVDDVPLGRIAAEHWRERLSGSYQDFMKFEILAGQSVSLGDMPRSGDRGAVDAAVKRANAGDVIDGLPRGYDTQLGATWTDGVDLSFGQWQKLALARGFMREMPLLLLLDEPTAALDAETEHALFEQFASQSRADNLNGRITVLVSHRFSTVRMADFIIVMRDSQVAEMGSHEELIARNGLYAELYQMQARAYQ